MERNGDGNKKASPQPSKVQRDALVERQLTYIFLSDYTNFKIMCQIYIEKIGEFGIGLTNIHNIRF